MKTGVVLFCCGMLISGIATASSTAVLEQLPWDHVVSQAKKEGSVTFNVWYLQPQWRSFVADFEKQYGIKVRIPEGSIDGNLNKLLAESRREKGKMDVVGLSVAQLPVIRKANALSQLSWLPGYRDAVHQLQSVDTQGYAVAFWGNQTGMAYDPTQLGEQSLPQTLEQLQHFIDANPKQFGYNDPNNGGAGEAFIQRVVTLSSGEFDADATKVDPAIVANWKKGWDWFISNKAKITQTASGADSLTRLNDGELLLVPAWEDHLAGLQKTGAITSRLKFYVPDFGMPGGGNIAGIAANSQHPAASAVFLNWLTQAETQRALNTVFGSVPMNKQVKTGVVQPGVATQFYGKEYSMQLRKEFVRQVSMQ